jgi:dCTP deaminase
MLGFDTLVQEVKKGLIEFRDAHNNNIGEHLKFQPASIDIHLGTDFYFYDFPPEYIIDPREDNSKFLVEYQLQKDGSCIIPPFGSVICRTAEWIKVPDSMACNLDGKSSIARLFFIIHATAGFFDPGFEGTGTLEGFNFNPNPILLIPGMPIGQFRFTRLEETCSKPYGHEALNNKYFGQIAATGSQMHRNFDANGRVL